MWRNSEASFGRITIGLHWLMALVIPAMFVLGWYMVDLTYYDELYKTLPHIHKSAGILLALVFLFRVVWKWSNPSPRPVVGSSRLEVLGARLVHALFYLVIALIMVSGYLISTAEGAAIDVFDWFSVPASITSIPDQEDVAGLVHEYLAYLLIVLVLAHALAALKHHFINRDDTLRRMLGKSRNAESPSPSLQPRSQS